MTAMRTFAQLSLLKTHAFVRSGDLVALKPPHVRERMADVLKNVNQVTLLFATKNFVSKKKAASARRRPKSHNGVDVSELQSVLDKLESTFSVIPNVKSEAIADKQKEKGAATHATSTTRQKGAPFLEEALTPALSQLVAARELAGKPKRRSRKRQRHSRSSGGRPKITGEEFDGMFQRLVRYKEEHGDCQVSKNYKEDVQVSHIFQMVIFDK